MKKIKLNSILNGSRVELRKHDIKYTDIMFKCIDQDRERLRAFLPWVDFTKTVQDSADYIADSLKKWDQYEMFDFSLFEKKSNTYMGNIGVHTISWENQCCEIGYWILGKYEGNGFVSEAVQILEQELFSKGFHRIEIRCSSINEKSANIPKRNGHTLEGELRDNSIELGKFRNTKIFAKLKSD